MLASTDDDDRRRRISSLIRNGRHAAAAKEVLDWAQRIARRTRSADEARAYFDDVWDEIQSSIDPRAPELRRRAIDLARVLRTCGEFASEGKAALLLESFNLYATDDQNWASEQSQIARMIARVHGRGDAALAERWFAIAERCADTALATAPTAALRAAAYTGMALIEVDALEARVRPTLSAANRALEHLGKAERHLGAALWPQGYEARGEVASYRRLRAESVQCAAAAGVSAQRAATLVPTFLRTLANCHRLVGNVRKAGWIYGLADEHPRPSSRARWRVALQRAQNASDINVWWAIAYLEQMLSGDGDELDRDIRAIGYADLAAMLREQHALHAAAEAERRRAALGDPRRLGRDRILELQADVDHLEDDDALDASGDPSTLEDDDLAIKEAATASTEKRRAVFLSVHTRGLLDAVELENPYAVVTHLRCLALTFDAIGKRYAADVASADMRSLVADAWSAIVVADAWEPVGRVRRTTARLPDASLRLEAARLRAEIIALEFATRFRPRAAVAILHTLIAWSHADEVRLEDHGMDRAQLHREAADRAVDLGLWYPAVKSLYASAVIAAEAGDLTAARADAATASHQLSEAIARLGLSVDRSDALVEHERLASGIAMLLAEAGGTSDQLIDAFETARGHFLDATRRGLARDLRDLRDATLRQWSVQSEIQLVEKSDLDTMSILRREKERADDAVRKERTRVLARNPERVWMHDRFKLRAFASTVRDVTNEPTVFISYLSDDRGVRGAGVRVDADGVVTHVTSTRLATPADLEVLVADVIADTFADGGLNAIRRSTLEEAHRVLLGGGLEDLVGGAAHVVVVPNRALARCPFHALIDPSGQHLAETHAVSFSPSLKAWRHLASTMHKPSRAALAIGLDATILAPDEVGMVADALRAVDAHVRAPDTEDGVVSYLLGAESYVVIHVAGHGVQADHDRPMRDVIRFPTFDVTAEELLRDGSRGQLVVLNMCNLGAQVSRRGDLFGFPFAALGGGSSTVVAATQPVSPEIAHKFARRFYAELMKPGATKLVAFTAAMRSMMRIGDERTSPSTWAPYVFIGDPRALAWSTSTSAPSRKDFG